MQPLDAFPAPIRRRIKGVLIDIDDTLTTGGRLTAVAYGALERLHGAGLIVVPVTGRPAGWCDHIARMWPVDAVVGENGAFYFRYDRAAHALTKRYRQSDAERADGRRRLDPIRQRILAEIPGSAVSADQAYREADLAIDTREDVTPLPPDQVARIVALFTEAGATAKVSSIHVNGWFGDYDKLTTTRTLLAECFGVELDREKEAFVFIGDSPNDAPLFGFFPNSVGVANVADFEDEMEARPAYVTRGRAGAGFAELADALLAPR